MKVEIFSAINNESHLKGAINNWFHNNENVKVIKILQSQSGRLDRHVVISIFYEENS